MQVLLRWSLCCALAACLLLPSGVAGQAPGVVEGRIIVPESAARKTISRYPTGTLAARGMQAVAPVVYLTGAALAGEASAARTVSGRPVEVLQRDTAFAPSAIAVRSGTTVAFPNADPFFHNVFSYSGNARFDLGRYPQGASRQVTFREEGVALVLCEVHEFMRAVVLVTDHAHHAVVAEDGSFRLEGVPPGEYGFVAYHPDLGRLEQRVRVGAGERVRLELALD